MDRIWRKELFISSKWAVVVIDLHLTKFSWGFVFNKSTGMHWKYCNYGGYVNWTFSADFAGFRGFYENYTWHWDSNTHIYSEQTSKHYDTQWSTNAWEKVWFFSTNFFLITLFINVLCVLFVMFPFIMSIYFFNKIFNMYFCYITVYYSNKCQVDSQ